MKDSTFWWITILITISAFFAVNFWWSDSGYRVRTVDGDGRGYYDYLPTLLLRHTVDFKETFEYEKAHQPLEYVGPNYHEVNGVYINKYLVGTALMILPFFVIAHILSPLFGLPADGYSILYQYEVALAALFWLWVGILFLWKLLKKYDISNAVSFWVILLLILGTNLFYYAFEAVAFSHLYSFAAIAAFLYYSKLLMNRFSVKYLVIVAFLLGWVVLIRPVNVIVILVVPLFSDSFTTFIKMLRHIFGSAKLLLLSLFVFLLAILPQLIINYLQTGNPIVYGYKNEGFEFLNPHLLNFLFSYKKGWLVYTPLMVLLLPAWIALYKKSKYHLMSFTIFIIVLLYIFSSWWNWFYGDGFGMRPMVDFYALFALVIAIWIEHLKKWQRILILILALPLTALNLVQTYQYNKGIIHVDSMTKEAYSYTFLKTDPKYRNVVGDADEFYYGTLSYEPLVSSRNNFETAVEGWSPAISVDTLHFYSPKHSMKMNRDVEFSSSYSFEVNSQVQNRRTYIILKAFCFEPTVDAALGVLFVVSIRDSSNRLKFYKAFRLKRLPDERVNKWYSSHIGFKLPKLTTGDKVKTYIWNKQKKNFFIDDMQVELYEIN